MTVYALILIDAITNMEGYQRYGAGFQEVFDKHAGTVLAREFSPPVIEGADWPYVTTVLLSFPDAEALIAWHHSPEYQALAQHRLQSTTGRIAMLPDLGLGNVEGPGKVYALVLIDNIADREEYARYGEGFMDVFSQYDGKLLAAGEDLPVIEGDWPIQRTALMVFPSVEGLNAWYKSPGYQKVAQHRWKSSTGRIVMLRGLS